MKNSSYYVKTLYIGYICKKFRYVIDDMHRIMDSLRHSLKFAGRTQDNLTITKI